MCATREGAPSSVPRDVMWPVASGRVSTGRRRAPGHASRQGALGPTCCRAPRPVAAQAAAGSAPSTQARAAAEAPGPASTTAALDEAWLLLRDFTLKEFRGVAQEPHLSSPDKRQRLRAALKLGLFCTSMCLVHLNRQTRLASDPTAATTISFPATCQLVYRQPHPASGWTGSPDAEVLLGVVASDIRFAARAYRDWCEELELPLVPPSSRVDGVADAMQVVGGVYLKYNSNTQLCYVSRYDGRDRGVLVQLGAMQLGHFPLGFFDEALVKPPPSF
ncbi:hypothetical protein TSOC_009444 [Tetrabaena socialis]|uniref:Uncharacterized protein n=1 Tax=Tetrabaena socialis TaxID=47790 RepID=A0A2J7ZVV2_9CHLO|nr:hypothetical protein TSOC_009444 [Tetrabaena socialis]|eukprot:PNH04389.1 hypothetical protein TSOC_009444 [Tetrabaena socialis]